MGFEMCLTEEALGPLTELGLDALIPGAVDEEDTADSVVPYNLQIYGAELECTGWSVDEKIAFLEDEANRAFLREFSQANRTRIMTALATDLAFD